MQSAESVKWAHRTARAADAPEAAVQALPPADAQEWCNFAVHEPLDLPHPLRLVSTHLRPEAPPGHVGGNARPDWTSSNRASYRLELAGGGTRVRIKQFLYDWAPPAFDHPSLWRSEVRPFEAGDDIGWLGHDFRKFRAASLHVNRTMIEIAVLEGEVSDESLQAICRGLRPVDDQASNAILEASLAELAYARRHSEPTIEVPTGYWRHRRSAQTPLRPLRGDELPAALHARWSPGDTYRLDTVFVSGELDAPVELEYVFDVVDAPGRSIRLLRVHGLPDPPLLDEQPCRSETLTRGGRAVHYAWSDERYGPHEALWRDGDVAMLLLVKPAPWTDRAWFERVLDDAMAVYA